MADEFQLGNGSWWDTSRNRFESGTSPASSSISTTLNAIASFGWPTEMVDMKSSRSSSSTAGAHDDQSSASAAGLSTPNLQMMGLGLSSQSIDWNQALLNEKGEGSFRSLLQEDLSSNTGGNFQPESGASSQEQWRQKLFSGDNEFKQINRGFSLDQPQSNDSTITSHSLTTGFQVDSAAAYGVLLSDYQNRQIANYPYPSGSGGYATEMIPPSMNKYPPFLRTSPPKQAGNSHLHFTNNTPFWNASAAMTDGARSGYFPPLQNQIPAAPSFDAKPKNKAEGRDLGAGPKKNSAETPTNKRARSETPSSLPAFKVRKEKMGDRITALQQLVSPFGKTDTASVLSEAIEYIKFLHEQVSALSAPYMKNGAPMQNQQQNNLDKPKDLEGGRQDLRSRGLCLVPVSSTFPVAHETAVDFWTPTFGGTFR